MKGSCLCGHVSYEVDQFIPHATHCHCSMCRKFHGAAFATYGVVERQSFRWLTGEEHLAKFIAPNGTIRTFCQQCGSSLAFESPTTPNSIDIALSTLDDNPNELPAAHIYTSFKAPWYQITDDLPSYDKTHDLSDT